MVFLRIVVSCLLLAATMMAQTSSKKSAGGGKADVDPFAAEHFALMSKQFIEQSLAMSPSNASQAGYHKHLDPKTHKTIELDAELDDVSPSGFTIQRRFYADWRARFRKNMPLEWLGVQDAVDWRLIDDNIALSLLELDRIQSYKYNPTVYVELIGNALFQPLTDEYAPKEVRLKHVLSRISQIARFLAQARQNLLNADPIFVKVAVEENDGNVDLVQNTIAREIPAGSPLRAQYDQAAPKAVAALKDFSRWLQDDLGKRKPTRTWRLGQELYAEKFRYVMETPVTPEQVLADAERDFKAVRAEMLRLATPMHRQMFPDHSDHSDLQGRERENKIIGEVLERISDDHPRRDHLLEAVQADVEGIKQFIREKKIVALSGRDNLKIIPTPPFMRGIYSVGGFHSAPPLEPQAEAQYWVTPIDPKTPVAKAESRLREYNNWTLKWLTIHEALPGHYIQFEHANDLQPPTRRVLRALLGNGPYVEGWAEYIAQVMMDAGYPNNGDPRFQLMMKKIRLRLLANAILDVRLHTSGMAEEQAMELMTREAFQTQAEAEGKMQRAKLSSCQLPTYYVGLRDWLALRKEYEARMGKEFDMLKFHNLVLDQGPLPITLLREIVLPPSKAAPGK